MILRTVTMSKRAPQLKIKGRVKKTPKLTIVPFPQTAMGKKLSSTNQMALRTGGWANPSSGGELKFADLNTGQGVTFGVDTFGAAILLNGIAQGTTASTRVGRKLTIKSLLLKYTWNRGAASTGGSPLRILVVYDRQTNATAPAITDILVVDEFTSPNNLSNRDRFITIFDHIAEDVGGGDVTGGYRYCTSGVLYKSLNLEQMFNTGNAGTVGDITSGSIYLFVAQAGFLATANGNFTMYSRMRYTDV